MENADWQIIIEHSKSRIDALETAFGEEALAIASFEVEEKTDHWRSTVLLAEKPDVPRLRHALGEMVFSVRKVERKDWVRETQANFPPRGIGRFLVLGSHHLGVSEAGSIVLRLDAGAAFGTGEHATTEGCLRALEWVAKKGMRSGNRISQERGAGTTILDMGCGSGILGIAAAKRIPAARVVGVEIDPAATRVARENAEKNHVAARCRMVTGNGYHCLEVRGKYPLIFANILARPLVTFAPALARHLAPGGHAVLSGLLNAQAQWVLAAHRAQGLALARRVVIGEWTTLVVVKT